MGLNHKLFYSKLLLFGEYTVTVGSGAIAMPYSRRSGYWQYNIQSLNSSESLRGLLKYLEEHKELSKLYNLSIFKEDIANGLIFNSDIPTGYGLGSSGALVAALYDRYATQKTDDLIALIKILGATESAFHGSSSGFDPLVSYLNESIIIKENGIIEKTLLDISDVGFFLIDTGISRQTEYFVDIFKNKLRTSADFNVVVQTLSAENKEAITSLQIRNSTSLFEATKNISKIQLDHFREMIPKEFLDTWSQGLETGKFCLKLCGAGGGGMILGLLADPSENIDFGKGINVILL